MNKRRALGRCLVGDCIYHVAFMDNDDLSEEEMIRWMNRHCDQEHRDPDWSPVENPEDGVDPVDWKGDPEQCKWVIKG